MSKLVNPHGGKGLKPLLLEGKACEKEMAKAKGLKQVPMTSRETSDLIMMGIGAFTPLEGFMGHDDWKGVCDEYAMPSRKGLFWPIPITLSATQDVAGSVSPGEEVALWDTETETIMGSMKITDKYTIDKEHECKQVFRTDDMGHPGVLAFNSAGKTAISGPIQVLNYSYFETDFPETFRTAVQIRNEIESLGWSKVVAFQTRNPMHRAHEELCRMAKEAVGADGILIHMLLGKLKPGDIPADVRDAAIRKMVDLYFPPKTVMITGYGFDMLYAGPREAVLHAVFRQNCGCTHLIVGRDHAGVGSYYGGFDAQTIFDEEVQKGALEIEIFKADHTAWSKKLKKVIMMRDAPDHTKEDWVFLSTR